MDSRELTDDELEYIESTPPSEDVKNDPTLEGEGPTDFSLWRVEGWTLITTGGEPDNDDPFALPGSLTVEDVIHWFKQNME